MSDEHYLRTELYELVRTDPTIFDFLQQGSLDGVWYWDLTDPEHEWMSPRFWEVFGHDPATKEHKSSAWQDMIHPDDLATALENFHAHCDDPDHPYDQLVRYRHRDGSTVWVRCRGVAVRDETGRPIRMLGAHNEVTSLKEAERSLAAQIDALHLSNQRLERFAAVASHDLREPLRTMGSFLRLLDERLGDRLDDDERRQFQYVVDASRNLDQMIEGLLRLSRLQRSDPEFSPVALDEVVATTLETFSDRIEAAGAAIEAEALPTVLGDRAQLIEVFDNLLANALKFAGDRPPSVIIAARREGPRWTITFRDHGIGFDPAHADKIFEIFGRLHARRHFAGSGIGLAVVRDIVEHHGGRITVDAAPGAGATFTFSLPALPP